MNSRETLKSQDVEKIRFVIRRIESEAKRMAGDDPLRFYPSRKEHANKQAIEKMEKLLWRREKLLNRLFLCTDEEKERFRWLNGFLYEKTRLMYSRTAQLYRDLLQYGRNAEFDTDYEVDGTLTCCIETPEDVLSLPNDDYYGSDFGYMMQMAYFHAGYEHSDIWCDIEKCHIRFDPHHTPQMTDKELKCVDELNDGQSWLAGSLRRPEFSDVCICHAMYTLSGRFLYSLPDMLRINNCWTEAQITCQNIVECC